MAFVNTKGYLFECFNYTGKYLYKCYIDIKSFGYSTTKMSSHKDVLIKSFVFLDSETTGLPSEDNNTTRMTELSMVSIQADHLMLGVYPRIQNKLQFCFNPGKYINPDATKITGLSNELLEYQSAFNDKVFQVINNFLNLLQKPVCLVAHNGNRFDFPILRKEIHRSGNGFENDILCVDSLLAFRALHNDDLKNADTQEVPIEFQDGFDELLCNAVENMDKGTPQTSTRLSIAEIQKINETTPTKCNFMRSLPRNSPFDMKRKQKVEKKSSNILRKLNFGRTSFKLGEIYKRLTSKDVTAAHTAEYDVQMLIECAAVLGDKFVNWCNLNAKRFCDIPMMEPDLQSLPRIIMARLILRVNSRVWKISKRECLTIDEKITVSREIDSGSKNVIAVQNSEYINSQSTKKCYLFITRFPYNESSLYRSLSLFLNGP